MNRLTRYVALPLLFASMAVSTVVVLGEPVRTDAMPTAQPAADAVPVTLIEVRQVSLPDGQRAAEASRMRWRLTLPGARRRGCCAGPV